MDSLKQKKLTERYENKFRKLYYKKCRDELIQMQKFYSVLFTIMGVGTIAMHKLSKVNDEKAQEELKKKRSDM